MLKNKTENQYPLSQKEKSIVRRLVTGTFNYGLGQVIGRFIGFLLIPVYTLYLTPADYGVVEICASLGTFVVILMRLGVPGSVTRYYFDFKDDPEALASYVSFVHKLLLVASLVIGMTCGLLLYYFGEKIMEGVLFFPFILLTLISAAFSSNSDLQKRLLVGKEQSAYSAKLNVATTFTSIILTIIFVAGFNLGAMGFLLGQMVTSILFFIQAQLYLRPYIGAPPTLTHVKKTLNYGAGILPHHLFAAASPLFARAILAAKHSVHELGLFSLASRFTQPLTIGLTMFNFAFHPIYFSLRKKAANNYQINKLLQATWVLAVMAFLCVIFLAPMLIPLLTPDQYLESASIVPILSVGFLGHTAYLICTNEIYFQTKTKYISAITGSGMFVNLILSMLMVKKYGAWGIAWADSMTYVTWAIGAHIFHLKMNSFKLNYSKFILPTITAAVGLFIVVKFGSGNLLLNLTSLVVLGGALFFTAEVKTLMQLLKVKILAK